MKTTTLSIETQVIDFLSFSPKLSDYIDDSSWIADEVNIILHDDEDDKLARIRDVYFNEFNKMASFVAENHEIAPTASWLYNEIVDEDFLEDEDE